MGGTFDTLISASSEPATAPVFQVWQRPIPLAAAAVALLLVGGLAVWAVTRPEPTSSPDVMRFVITPPTSAPLNFLVRRQDLAISPDGTQVVYHGPAPNGGPQLSLRSIDQFEGTSLRGGEGGRVPFVSFDGEWVGFLAGATTLEKVSIFGGPPVMLTESLSPIIGASWGADDRIIFGTLSSGLLRVAGGGGDSEVLTTLDRDQGDVRHTWPFIIPDRQAVLFVTSVGPPRRTGQLAVLDLSTGEVRQLGLAGVSPRYVPTGHLVYAAEDGSVRAVPFDTTSLEVTGNPVPLLEGVMVKPDGAANFSISHNGRLVYALAAGRDSASTSLAWVDRAGTAEVIETIPAGAYDGPRLSPDATAF